MHKKIGFILLFLASCGYQFKGSKPLAEISIPYVVGDEEGLLTTELVKECMRTGEIGYSSGRGDFRLDVEVLSDATDPIGFRYDRDDLSGRVQKNLISTEGRRTIGINLKLVKRDSEQVVLGPLTVTASEDFDYADVNSLHSLAFVDTQMEMQKVLDFSLGQLSSVEGAEDGAINPLYRKLAEKTVSILINSGCFK
jgi:hypothetical protein